MTRPARIDFTIGSRRLASVERRLADWSFSLRDVLAGADTPIRIPEPGPDGLRVLSAPEHMVPAITALAKPLLIGAEQSYPRHYIDMRDLDYDGYLAGFSGKTRSTLRRKAKKLRAVLGDGCRVTEHRTVGEVEAFLDAALPLSAKTYQARLLDAGLPDDAASRAKLLSQAEAGAMRCFLLHSADGPIAYLSLPVDGRTLVYAHLGYDPVHASLSPGTVLQLEALERLFAEQTFDYFDFTEGEGAHKAMFGTHSVRCTSFVLLKPSLANRVVLSARSLFDAGIGVARAFAERSGALARIRSSLRA
jgi:CelD/BcsL family acetyltransferase involved in cellulose biosynthesis